MSDVKMVEGGMDQRAKDLWELRDKYASLLARHNALREAVAWARECRECGEWLHLELWSNDPFDLEEVWDLYLCARAEVDRLIGGE